MPFGVPGTVLQIAHHMIAPHGDHADELRRASPRRLIDVTDQTVLPRIKPPPVAASVSRDRKSSSSRNRTRSCSAVARPTGSRIGGWSRGAVLLQLTPEQSRLEYPRRRQPSVRMLITCLCSRRGAANERTGRQPARTRWRGTASAPAQRVRNSHDRSVGSGDGDVHAEHLQAVRHGATLVANTDAVEP